MTPVQYERWKDFSLRLARTLPGMRTRPSIEWVEEQVENFFYRFDGEREIAETDDWDSGPHYVCDRVREMEDEVARGERAGFLLLHWDDDVEPEEAERREALGWDQWGEQWFGPVRACIRAGLDVACEPSAGVVGFTVGDLRKMYPEGIPDWVATPEKPFTDDDGQPIDLRTRPDEEGVWL